MAHPTIFDREWEILMKSGQLRNEFDRLRKLVIDRTKERDDALERVSMLEQQLQYARRAAPAAAVPVAAAIDETVARLGPPEPTRAPVPAPRSRRPAPAPVVQAPQPAPVEEEKEEVNLDDSATRFGLLELD